MCFTGGTQQKMATGVCSDGSYLWQKMMLAENELDPANRKKKTKVSAFRICKLQFKSHVVCCNFTGWHSHKPKKYEAIFVYIYQQHLPAVHPLFRQYQVQLRQTYWHPHPVYIGTYL